MTENMVVNIFQHQVPGFNGGPIRIKGGKTRGNQIRVDKNGAVCLVGQKLPGKCVFAGTVGTAMMRALLFFRFGSFKRLFEAN